MTADIITTATILALTLLAALTLRWSRTSPRARATAHGYAVPRGGITPGAVADPPSAGGGTGSPTLLDVSIRIDELERENRRIKSELRQALAQRDIARRQRDEARATGGWKPGW